MVDSARSYELITHSDLIRLGEISRADREDFFERKPEYKVLQDRIIAVALCQGAALHYVDEKNGVKDFDVWTFYAQDGGNAFPQRRLVVRDFDDPKFGQSPDHLDFVGRKVDLLGRALRVEYPCNPIEVLRAYLIKKRTASATELAKKAIILIEPSKYLGYVVWPQ